jgi:hypothetical protein
MAGVIIAMRVDCPERQYIVPGSEVRKCSHCDAEVVISPSSLELLKGGEAQEIICLECISIDEIDAAKMEMPNERQRLEMLQVGVTGPMDEQEGKEMVRGYLRRRRGR